MTTLVASRPAVGAGTDATYLGLEAAFDGVSRRHLERTGLGAGWDCWEVGAGGGSIARWLADRVRPTGSVLATDIDAMGMSLGRLPNLRVQHHDVAAECLPASGFRCIHARLVLGQVPDRIDVLKRLVSALDREGWLVVEDFLLPRPALPEPATADERLVHRVRSGFTRLLRELRGDAYWASTLPRRLRALGLADVGASTHVASVAGGSSPSAVERAHLRGVEEQLVTSGVATHEEVDRCVELLGDPGFRFTMPPVVSAWGRRAAAPN